MVDVSKVNNLSKYINWHCGDAALCLNRSIERDWRYLGLRWKATHVLEAEILLFFMTIRAGLPNWVCSEYMELGNARFAETMKLSHDELFSAIGSRFAHYDEAYLAYRKDLNFDEGSLTDLVQCLSNALWNYLILRTCAGDRVSELDISCGPPLSSEEINEIFASAEEAIQPDQESIKEITRKAVFSNTLAWGGCYLSSLCRLNMVISAGERRAEKLDSVAEVGWQEFKPELYQSVALHSLYLPSEFQLR